MLDLTREVTESITALDTAALDTVAQAVVGWLSADPGALDLPPVVAVEVSGHDILVVTAHPATTPEGVQAHQFRCVVPAIFKDGTPREVRVWNLATGMELSGSPVAFAFAEEDAPHVSPAPMLGASAWRGPLAGIVRAVPRQFSADLFVEPDAPGQTLRYEFLSRLDEKSRLAYGIRLTLDVARPIAVHHRLTAVFVAATKGRWLLSSGLPTAPEPVAQAHVEYWLTRRTATSCDRLRRLRRGRVFRRTAAQALMETLTAEELDLAAAGELWLTIAVAEAHGLTSWAPIAAPPPAADAAFEDDRLDGAFEHMLGLAQVHRPAIEHDGAGITALPRPSPRSAAGSLEPAPDRDMPFTQIIIPVYNGGDVIEECLRSVQARTPGPFQVLMVDDGSRSNTSAVLRAIATEDPRFVLHRRDVNRGYTKSVNEGVSLTGADWVVVLNSDTVVSQDWLLRMHLAARARSDVGMVGPLSNAATWQSIPEAKRADGSWSTNDLIESRHVPQIQAILSEVSERAYPEFPLLNGFCTLISRAVFARIGLLDEDAFPIGYGEETDLCLRTAWAGFRLAVADDCFVYHHKSVSFGSANRSRLTRAGGLELTNKHIGVSVPVLERAMQQNDIMTRLRWRMTKRLKELV